MSHKKYDNELDQHLADIAVFLPHQGPIKDFIHHNTLDALMDHPFHEANKIYSETLGFKTYLSLSDYRKRYGTGEIKADHLEKSFKRNKELAIEFSDLFDFQEPKTKIRSWGLLRQCWQEVYKIDMDHWVYPKLFRLLAHATDQGITQVNLFSADKGLIENIRELEGKSYFSLFLNKKGRARKMLLEGVSTESILEQLVDSSGLKQYLLDLLLGHPGWSGMIYSLDEHCAHQLRKPVRVSLRDLVHIEALFELDVLDYYAPKWSKVTLKKVNEDSKKSQELLQANDKLYSIYKVWQEALESSVHDSALSAIRTLMNEQNLQPKTPIEYQAVFCIDDRESSIRTHLEFESAKVETFAMAGFFGIEFLYRDEKDHYLTQLCPAPLKPKHWILGGGGPDVFQKDWHLTFRSHGLLSGFLLTPTFGVWSAIHLLMSFFRPRLSQVTTSAFNQSREQSELHYEQSPSQHHTHLQLGFRVDEMVDRIEKSLRSMGLISDFAPLIYIVGHGATSTNNPHYSAYDCGACSGRPGSINARVFCSMANRSDVREQLALRGIHLPSTTYFVPALHDTTQDLIVYYDDVQRSVRHSTLHASFQEIMNRALQNNAQERARRLPNIESGQSASSAHKKVQERSQSLFETRPELNHANNCFCIIGQRKNHKSVFWDRRAFLNSYNPQLDPSGAILESILSAVFPVCGGINLEYYYSRVDNVKTGAGSKLPHNVVSLLGVANGVEGDLRPGLPRQMIELHDPLRLMVVVEQTPEMVVKILQNNQALNKWVKGEWVLLRCYDPQSKTIYNIKPDLTIESIGLPPASLVKGWPNRLFAHRENIEIGILGVHNE